MPAISLWTGVWFYPGTRRLHIIDGHGADDGGNDECAIEDELVPGTSYNIRVSMRQHYVEVFYNNVMKCTEPRKDRRVFATAQVFASDPWYEPGECSNGRLGLVLPHGYPDVVARAR